MRCSRGQQEVMQPFIAQEFWAIVAAHTPCDAGFAPIAVHVETRSRGVRCGVSRRSYCRQLHFAAPRRAGNTAAAAALVSRLTAFAVDRIAMEWRTKSFIGWSKVAECCSAAPSNRVKRRLRRARVSVRCHVGTSAARAGAPSTSPRTTSHCMLARALSFPPRVPPPE